MASKLQVVVLDLVPQGPATSMWARVMNANMASVMASVVGVWCQQSGHDVHYECYTGFEDLSRVMPHDADVVFVSSFTRSAHLAYAISRICRRRGAVTVLGGPHARCFPDDAGLYFDYVLGFTDRAVIAEVLGERAPHRPLGRQLAATRQPDELPTLEERWPFVEATLAKAPLVKLIPMIGALGCPYTCSFCIDAEVDFAPLAFERLRDDLRFAASRVRRPRIGWHDPNFGIRFDETLDAIEQAVPPGTLEHVAETSLSLLSEPHLRRMRRAGFKALLPGIESWYAMGGKSRTGVRTGEEKVRQVAAHVNMVSRYIPYVQANFVFGLDCDHGPEPFELTKKFFELCPEAFPAYSLLTAFGEAAPLNLELQRAGRVLPFPFHFLDNNQAMNVKPLHYEWPEFYDRIIDLNARSFSVRAIRRRLWRQGPRLPGVMNMIRAMSSEGWGRFRYFSEVRGRLDTDAEMRSYFEGDSTRLPEFYRARVQRKLGDFWEHLPEGALEHDPYAYLKRASGTEARMASIRN